MHTADPTAEDRTSRTDDARIAHIANLPTPEALIHDLPIKGVPAEALVLQTRARIRSILRGEDKRFLLVMGPCSIHDPKAAMEYAQRLAALRAQLADRVEIVMRVYFEKPRTTIGWKGLINDPHLDGSFRIEEGLRIARRLLIDITNLGVPCGSEFLDVISPQYIGDLIAWGAIGARTVESQVHRELASGLSAPIGFKNGTSGAVKVAAEAVLAAAQPHHFLSVHKNGVASIVRTRGNADCHIILRGGSKGPNYDEASIAAACEKLRALALPERVMVDCSHANANKEPQRQTEVARHLAGRLRAGEAHIFGAMLESHLIAGAQHFTPGKDNPATLRYGQSITDGCLGWEDSVAAAKELASAVG